MLAVLEPWWPEPGSVSRQGKEMGGWHSLARRAGARRGGEDIHEGEGGWRRWEDASTCRCEGVRNTERSKRGEPGGVGSGRTSGCEYSGKAMAGAARSATGGAWDW